MALFEYASEVGILNEGLFGKKQKENPNIKKVYEKVLAIVKKEFSSLKGNKCRILTTSEEEIEFNLEHLISLRSPDKFVEMVQYHKSIETDVEKIVKKINNDIKPDDVVLKKFDSFDADDDTYYIALFLLKDKNRY